MDGVGNPCTMLDVRCAMYDVFPCTMLDPGYPMIFTSRRPIPARLYKCVLYDEL